MIAKREKILAPGRLFRGPIHWTACRKMSAPQGADGVANGPPVHVTSYILTTSISASIMRTKFKSFSPLGWDGKSPCSIPKARSKLRSQQFQTSILVKRIRQQFVRKMELANEHNKNHLSQDSRLFSHQSFNARRWVDAPRRKMFPVYNPAMG